MEEVKYLGVDRRIGADDSAQIYSGKAGAEPKGKALDLPILVPTITFHFVPSETLFGFLYLVSATSIPLMDYC